MSLVATKTPMKMVPKNVVKQDITLATIKSMANCNTQPLRRDIRPTNISRIFGRASFMCCGAICWARFRGLARRRAKSMSRARWL